MSQYNPYAAPQAAPPMLAGPMMPGGGTGPQPWEIGEVLGHGWNAFKANWATLFFAQLLAGFLGAIPTYIPGILVAVQAVDANSAEYWSIYAACMITSLLFVNTFFQVGLTKMCLAAARQQSPQFGDLFSGGGRYLSLMGATALLFLAAILGYMLFIIPGIILLLGLCLSSFYVVDQNMGPIEAMKASWAATSGQKGNIFLFGLLGFLIFLGGCAACYFGIFAATSVLTVSMATIYLRLSGQWGGGGPAFGPPGLLPGGYAPPGGYGPPPAGGFGPPPGGGYGPPGGGGGYGPPGGGGGYGPPGGGGGYGPPGGGGGGYGPPGGGGGGYGPPA
jgi:uncharacterized membrane protein